MGDHYATLGVDPDSSPEVIRTAYLRLMRRYHPDRNPAPAAQAKVRKITAAYAVLGVTDRRAQYDAQLSPVRVARPATYRAATYPPQPQSGRRPSWIAAAFSVAAVVLLTILLLPPVLPPISEPMPGVGGGRAMDVQDHAPAAATFNPGTVCSSPSASGLIKRELFRRAAYLRGSDGAEFGRLAGASLLKLDVAATQQTNQDARMVSCTATIVLTLPPGVTVNGGQSGLIETVGYSVHRGDGKDRATLRLADASKAIGMLATLSWTPMQVPQVVDPAPAAPIQPPVQPPIQPPMSKPPPAQWVPSARTTSTAAAPAAPPRTVAFKPSVTAPRTAASVTPPRTVAFKDSALPQRTVAFTDPSFSCNAARSWAARSVCNSATLAALDRQLAALWGDSMARAYPVQRAQLLRSDGRFLANRDRCSSVPCVHGAYTAQIREIQTIMAGQTLPTHR